MDESVYFDLQWALHFGFQYFNNTCIVQRESLPELEINFQMKSYANRSREICLKSVKTKCFDFCKALCLAFLGAMSISKQAIFDWNMPINVKCLYLSHTCSNLCFGCAFDSCGSYRSSKHSVSSDSPFSPEYRPPHPATFPKGHQRGTNITQIKTMEWGLFIFPHHPNTYLWKTWSS